MKNKRKQTKKQAIYNISFIMASCLVYLGSHFFLAWSSCGPIDLFNYLQSTNNCLLALTLELILCTTRINVFSSCYRVSYTIWANRKKKNFFDKHSKEDALVTLVHSAQLLLSAAAPVLASRTGTVVSLVVGRSGDRRLLFCCAIVLLEDWSLNWLFTIQILQTI